MSSTTYSFQYTSEDGVSLSTTTGEPTKFEEASSSNVDASESEIIASSEFPSEALESSLEFTSKFLYLSLFKVLTWYSSGVSLTLSLKLYDFLFKVSTWYSFCVSLISLSIS